MAARATLQEVPDFFLVLAGPLYQMFRRGHLTPRLSRSSSDITDRMGFWRRHHGHDRFLKRGTVPLSCALSKSNLNTVES
jgi:hypothetical protein